MGIDAVLLLDSRHQREEVVQLQEQAPCSSQELSTPCSSQGAYSLGAWF